MKNAPAVFLTGATGFLGSYVAAELLMRHDSPVAALVRSRTEDEAKRRLWEALQLHMDFPAFRGFLNDGIRIYTGDVTRPGLGLSQAQWDRLVQTSDSVIHCAAALNRRSQEACINVNLKGTLEVARLGQAMQAKGTLRRFSNVSTVAVAGRRSHETVSEDRAVQWLAPDPDPYAQTKKFAEHMVKRLLPEDKVLVFRPSAIIGDSRFPQTTQFDMIRALDLFARAPLLPLDPGWRIDIVPADYVARAVAAVHMKAKTAHATYHVSAGELSLSYREVVRALSGDADKTFAPGLLSLTAWLCARLAKTPARWGAAAKAILVQVFLEHLKSDTVYDNKRIVEETGEAPAPFSAYAEPLLRFARENRFRYPAQPWMEEEPKKEVA